MDRLYIQESLKLTFEGRDTDGEVKKGASMLQLGPCYWDQSGS